jgi:diguanylate cyclase (GGDEF)-like protein
MSCREFSVAGSPGHIRSAALAVVRGGVLGVALAALGAAAHGADYERRFDRLGVAEGLSDSHTTALAQDARGYLWIGTSEGLNRFDGSTVRVFRRSADGGARGLASNRISALLVTREGTLWVGTQGGGLSRYDPEMETFITFRHDPADPTSLSQDDIADLEQDAAGRLWIATFRGGLSLLDRPQAPAPLAFRRIVHDADEPASLVDDRTRAVLADRFGEVWVATMRGLDRLVGDPLRGDPSFAFVHAGNRPEDPTSLPDDEVWALCRDAGGDLWVGMWGSPEGWGLARARLPAASASVPDRLAFERFGKGDAATDLIENRVMRIFEDGRGTIWIGTLGGLLELGAEERERERPLFRRHYHDPNWRFSLPDSGIHDLVEDDLGDLWLATEGGVGRIDRSREEIVTLRVRPESEAGLSGGTRDAWIDRQGVLWVATSSGLDRVDLGSDGFEVRHYPGDPGRTGIPGVLPVPSPHQLLETADGWLWMTSFRFLAAVPPLRDRISPPTLAHVAEGLSSNAVLSVHEDASGTLWAGTYRGLHRIARDGAGRAIGVETWRHDPDDPESLSSQSVSAIVSGPEGELWVGTYVGLNRFDPTTGRARRYLADRGPGAGPSHEYVTSLAFDPAGALWIGTRGGGLDRLDPRTERFGHYGIAEGLPSENVYSIRTDARGRVWFASPRGLVRLDPANDEVRVFDSLDGLPDDSIGSLRFTRDGRLLLLFDSGVSLLDPERLTSAGRAPPVELTGLRIRNRPVPIAPGSLLERSLAFTERLVLDHDFGLVSIEFAAVSFRRSPRVRFRYRLEGLDQDWIETGADDARAIYTTLPPGRYDFRVQGADGDGAWNEEGASLAIRVLPPWYGTWWARSAAVALILGAVVAVPLGRLRRVRRLNVLLEARVAERTEELVVANRKLDEAARADFLTGLPNRRELFECAERLRIAQQRTGRPFALAIADLDGFKAINDSRGHDCGDFVLVEIARLLRATVRAQDVVARWGGEELIFLFPDTDADGARVVAEKTRAATEAHRFPWNGDRLSVTLTIGVVEVAPDTTLEAALQAADAALYAGKRAGKNRVVTAAPAGA